MNLTVGLIKASLPSYFPEKYNVFETATRGLEQVAADHEARLVVAPDIPMDAAQTRQAISYLEGAGADLILLLHGGFSMGEIAREVARHAGPVGFWATPEPHHAGDVQLNNFVSLNMSLSIARDVRPARAPAPLWLFGAIEEQAVHEKIAQTLDALRMMKSVRGARIGLVGGVAPGFYNMQVCESALSNRFGVEIVHYGIDHLRRAIARQDADEVGRERAAMNRAAPFDGVSDAQAELTARTVLGLRQLAREGGFDALAVSDWPDLQDDPGMHPGAAFSWLEECDNLPVASEGDVMGAITQLAVKGLTGKVGCILDMTSPRPDKNQILMWHGGGGPFHLSDGRVRLINHPMIGRGTAEGPVYGAIADYRFARGPVTVCRIGESGDGLFAFEAEVVDGDEPGFDGCRGWLTDFVCEHGDASAHDVVSAVMAHGVEHHFILIQGRHLPALRAFSRLSGTSWQAVAGHNKS